MGLLAVFGWLLLGTGLQLLSFGRWMTPLAAWLAPVFFLHFTHNMPPLAGALWVWLALAIAFGISLRGIVPIPGVAYLALPVVWGLFGALPFLIDRIAAPLVPGFAATLVLPVAWTALEFLNARVDPYGTWGATAYTQHGVLPLMQLASVTGVWGIGFIVAWFAAVLNWAWDQHFVWSAIQHGVVIFASVTSIVFLIGGLRVVLAPHRETVRVAGIGWPEGVIERTHFMRAVQPGLEQAARDELNVAFKRIQDLFLSRTEREARAGAKMIVWPEANLIVFDDEEQAFVDRARVIAREFKIYLLMGLATLYPNARYTFRNHAVLLTPTGDTAYDYTKITSVPGFEKKYSLPGDKPIPFADTEFGRIASPICYDMDFDRIVAQVGRGNADLMLVPASDWRDIMPLHQQMAEFRAIENGTALFRITRWGGSGAVDPFGRRLAWMDDFSARDNIMVAQVPIHAGVRTLYSRIGDAFAWLCVGGLLACLVLWLSNVLFSI